MPRISRAIAIVGAFSFVNADIPDNAVAYGIPAKVKRMLLIFYGMTVIMYP
jgi:serine acetyltransferase